MALSARTRWLFYAVAGAATAGAIAWVEQREDEQVAVVPVAASRAPVPATDARSQLPADGGEVKLEWLKRKPGEDFPRGDPFSTRGPAQQQAAAPPPPPPPPPPPQAPPLPFSYLGKWTEQGRTTIFLGRGERHIAVRGPGKLDDTYTVESVDDRQIVLNYVPLGIRQTLPLVPGAPPVQAAGGAPSLSEPDQNEETN